MGSYSLDLVLICRFSAVEETVAGEEVVELVLDTAAPSTTTYITNSFLGYITSSGRIDGSLITMK